MSKVATNQALLKALGIDQPLITAVQINVQPDKLPVVTIERLIDCKAMLHEVSHFDLVLREEAAPAPAPTPAFDLDAMCTAASDRLAASLRADCRNAMDAHIAESTAIRKHLDKAIHTHWASRLNALCKLAFGEANLSSAALTKGLLASSGVSGLITAWTQENLRFIEEKARAARRSA